MGWKDEDAIHTEEGYTLTFDTEPRRATLDHISLRICPSSSFRRLAPPPCPHVTRFVGPHGRLQNRSTGH